MNARLIVVYRDHAEVVTLDTDYKYLSDYAETEIAESIWRKLNDMEPDANIAKYEHVRTKLEPTVEFEGNERDALLYCAGKYAEYDIMTYRNYSRELDKEYDRLDIGAKFVAEYEEAMEGVPPQPPLAPGY